MALDVLFDTIPSNWKELTLGEICKLSGGEIQIGPFGSQLHAEDYVVDGVPSIMPQNIGDNYIDTTDIARVSAGDLKRLKKHIVQEGDIVYSRRGDITRRALIHQRENGWLCGTGCIRIRPGEKALDSAFAFYYLGHPKVRNWIISHAVGATMPNLNTSILSNIPFLLPPLDEQKEMAKSCQLLDRAISNLRRQNETLEAIAQTLFKYWFVDFEFPNADGKPYKSSGGAMRSSDLGEIPAGCRVGRLGDEVETLGGGTPSTKEPNYWVNGDIPWYSPTDLTKSNTLFSLGSEKQITHLGLEKSSAKLFPAYSILLTSRATIGEITINTLPASTNQGFITLIPNEKFSVYFLHGWLLTQTRLIKQLASGSTFPELSKSSFRKFLFLIPNQIQLESYNKIIKPLFQRVENNIKQIQTLTKTRDVLLPKLMSGKLRIGG